MKRQLLLLRHGKSDWDSGKDDYHRPLKSRGVRAAQRIAVWLLQQQIIPDYIVSSTAERAMATTIRLCHTMGIGIRQIHRDKNLYLANTQYLLKALHEIPGTVQQVLLVAHNPGLEELVTLLAEEAIDLTEEIKLLPTAALALFELECEWSELTGSSAKLLSIIKPRTLPKTFPFPSPNG